MASRTLVLVALTLIGLIAPAAAAPPKKVVILAGPKSHGPVGNGVHDYGWSARLIKMMLETCPVKEKVRVEVHLEGWPRNPRTLEDADTIMVISDGRDGDQYAEAPHLASAERVRFMEKQMKRGCGFLTFHFSTFAPQQYADRILDWSGGYFQWETDGKRKWYSAIATTETEVKLGAPDHPIGRGLTPFKMKEEFYYNIRFAPKDATLKPIWVVPALSGREPDGRVVAWARERADGGRGFGTTCGHFYDNWKHDQFRKMILNAIAWTAKVEVPAAGVEAKFYTHEEIERHENPPILVLILAGNDAHKWHNWERTTPAIKAALEKDPRIRVDVATDFEDLARKKLSDYHVIVQNNYANWHDPKGPSAAAKKAFVDFLQNGGGLVLVHFANGAFHFSLPEAGASDWPEYRKIVRRVWNHQGKPPSGHDPFGPFVVEPTNVKHAITDGLKSFEVTDELYFRQDGTEPIEPLIAARSRITKTDEPLAWVYSYGKGRVFQTLLGHSEKTYDAFEGREMLRRAVAWCANREVRPLDPATEKPPEKPAPLTEGKFGKALDARAGGAFVEGRKEYREPPLTAECWAKLNGKGPYHILIANELKSSATHWEMFAEAGNGFYTVYLPGYRPDHVRSQVDVTDGKWHHFAMLFEPMRVRLLLDGNVVADQKVEFQNGKPVAGRLAIGSLAGKEIGCGGAIDEARISKGIRESDGRILVPSVPYVPDDRTVGLWHLDRIDRNRFADESSLKNAAVFEPHGAAAAPAGPSSPDRLDYEPADPRWKAVLIDRSQDDAYMGVKADGEGRLFVGGREALFVFEPDGQGGYRPKQKLLQFPPDSIIMGIEYRGNDLYVLTANALYLLPDARVKRGGITAKRLLWGLPLDLHVSFHCLAWGPEGDLYLNHGDPLLNHGDFSRPDHWGHWTLYCQPEGTKVPFTGTGAVLRIKPDGTHLRVVATGLRGPVGLCFDRNWNLFTNDNDHESIPDRYGYVRLLHVAPQIDFAWPRGWMASKSPDRSDLIEPMISNTGRGVPVGMAYFDEPSNGDWRNSLILVRWDRGSLVLCPLRQRGASFASEEKPLLSGRLTVRPTGVAVGGGRVFTTIHYLPGNVGTPHCVSDLAMLTGADDTAFSPLDYSAIPAAELWTELSRPTWGRRSQAHNEILRRGGPLLAEAVKRLAAVKDDDPAIRHLPWLAAASGSVEASQLLQKLALHPNADVRLQAVRALTEFPALKAPTELFIALLRNSDPRVRLAALGSFFDETRNLPLDQVADFVGSNDTYLSQTAAKILARRATPAQLADLERHGKRSYRLAAVLAAGMRLTIPGPDFIPPPELPLTYSSGNAFFKLTYLGEKSPIDLKALARCGSFTTADAWKSIKPTDEQRALLDLLRRLDGYSDVTLQGVYYLSLLRDPQIEPQLQRQAAKLRQARVAALNRTQNFNRAWVLGPVQRNGARQPGDRFPEDGSIDLSVPYGRSNSQVRWVETNLKDAGLNLQLRNEGPIAYMYFRLQSRRRQTVVLPDFSTNVWHNGVRVPIRTDIGMDFDLQPGSNDILITTTYVPEAFRILVEEEVAFVLPDRLDGAELARRLREAKGDERVPPEFLAVDWAAEMKKGDVAAGRRLFGTLACAKCHAITTGQEGGGAPSLADANKRFTVVHVVESVLLPSKQVAEPFRATRIEMKNGQTFVGLAVAERANEVELLLPDATRKAIAFKDIEVRTIMPTSPMPASLVKTPAELRDLLAYLLSDNPQPP